MAAIVRRCVGRPLGLSIFAAVLASLMAVPAGACTGDCNDDGVVTINEVITGVSIALDRSPISVCPRIDDNDDGLVSIAELIAAVSNLLNGCAASPTATASVRLTPTPSPSSTPTASPSSTPTASPTMTATVNQPPILPTASIYRTYPGFDIELPIRATDPDGGAVSCSADDLPVGAAFDTQNGLLSWTPASDQLGPFYVPFTCMDDAVPPASADGQLIFAVSALDSCAMPSCDPASGCTATLPPVSQTCCAAGPAARVAEPTAGCPAGRVLYIGRNNRGFGRLQDCDLLPLEHNQQTSAQAVFHIEVRCLNALNRVKVHAVMVSNAAKHPVILDSSEPPLFLLSGGANGFAIRDNLRFDVSDPMPYTDIEGAEANLTVTVTDSGGVSVSTQLRLRLTFTPVPDLPDLDPTATPLPTCLAGVTPAANQTPACVIPTNTPAPTTSNG